MREYDRARAKKSSGSHPLFTDQDDVTSQETRGYCSKEALKKATQRAKKRIPSDSSKFAEVIAHMVGTASPGKKAALNKLGITSSQPSCNATTVQDNLRKTIE